VGAWVPFNNDDDDYDASNTPDYQQTGAIAGENDLLPIVLHPVQPLGLGGTYRLNFTSGIRVWRNADRTGEVVAGVGEVRLPSMPRRKPPYTLKALRLGARPAFW